MHLGGRCRCAIGSRGFSGRMSRSRRTSACCCNGVAGGLSCSPNQRARTSGSFGSNALAVAATPALFFAWHDTDHTERAVAGQRPAPVAAALEPGPSTTAADGVSSDDDAAPIQAAPLPPSVARRVGRPAVRPALWRRWPGLDRSVSTQQLQQATLSPCVPCIDASTPVARGPCAATSAQGALVAAGGRSSISALRTQDGGGPLEAPLPRSGLAQSSSPRFKASSRSRKRLRAARACDSSPDIRRAAWQLMDMQASDFAASGCSKDLARVNTRCPLALCEASCFPPRPAHPAASRALASPAGSPRRDARRKDAGVSRAGPGAGGLRRQCRRLITPCSEHVDIPPAQVIEVRCCLRCERHAQSRSREPNMPDRVSGDAVLTLSPLYFAQQLRMGWPTWTPVHV